MTVPAHFKVCFPEAWLDDLAGWTAPTAAIALSEEDADRLGRFSTAYCRRMDRPRTEFLSDPLLEAIDAALADPEIGGPAGVMPRTSWCSWKAVTLDHAPCRTRDDVLAVITRDDARVGEGLAAMVGAGLPVFLHLRAWRDIPPASQFRVFVKGRRVMGASQYMWQDSYPDLIGKAASLATDLARDLPSLLADLPVDTCVVDILLRSEGIEVIELNPFGPMTGGCLFDWHRPGDLDGSLRLRGGDACLSLPLGRIEAA